MGEKEYLNVFGKSREETVAEAREAFHQAARSRDRSRAAEAFERLRRAFVGDDALWSNEVAGNLMSSVIMIFIILILGATLILFESGFYSMDNRLFLPLVLGCMLLLLSGVVLSFIFRWERKWLKYVLMIDVCLTVTTLSAVLGYRMTVSLILPVGLSTRYLSRKLTLRISLITAVLLFFSTIASATLMVSPDLNVLAVEPNTTVFVGDSLRSALVALPVDMPRYIYKLIVAVYIPNVLQLLLVSAICCAVAKWGHEAVVAQAQASEEFTRIDTELSMATNIQASMLPRIFPAFPDRREFSICASMTPAREVGGDFYDFFMVDERHLAIVVADVSGKGVPAALFMMIGKTLIKDHTHAECDLGQVFSEVNTILCESNSEELFITAFEGVLDLVTGEFRFVNAGHELPCLCRAGGQYEPQKIKHGFVLAGLPGVRYQAGTMQLAPGDKLFQYTDGVTEATDSQQQLFGMDRLLDALNENTDASPEALLPSVQAAIDAFVNGAPQFDDITMLALEFRQRMDPETSGKED